MGQILDYYKYTQAIEIVTGREKGSTSLEMAVNIGIVDKTKATIEEFLQAKNEEK